MALPTGRSGAASYKETALRRAPVVSRAGPRTRSRVARWRGIDGPARLDPHFDAAVVAYRAIAGDHFGRSDRGRRRAAMEIQVRGHRGLSFFSAPGEADRR